MLKEWSIFVKVKPKLLKTTDGIETQYLSFQGSTKIHTLAIWAQPQPYFRWHYQNKAHCTGKRGKCIPAPSRWRRVPRHLVFPSEGVQGQTTNLDVPPTQHDAFYKVVAKNSVGTDDVLYSVDRVSGRWIWIYNVTYGNNLR